jgi:hypothetical protein
MSDYMSDWIFDMENFQEVLLDTCIFEATDP